MSLVFDRRLERSKNPGYHALIVGISDYTYLPNQGEAATPSSFGMRRLASPALSAYKLYTWLLKADNSNLLPVPLTTVRLVVCPSPEEIAAEPRLAHDLLQSLVIADDGRTDSNKSQAFRVHEGSFEHVAFDMKAWRADAGHSTESYTLFSFSGHGVELPSGDAVMLLQGFGEEDTAPLSSAVKATHIVDGMAPNSSGNAARSQLYLFDMCRTKKRKFQEFVNLQPREIWSIPITSESKAELCAPLVYATHSGGVAEAMRGSQTIFNWALLKCLEDGIGGEECEESDLGRDDRAWHVTNGSLSRRLKAVTYSANDEFDTSSGEYEQRVVWEGSWSHETRICKLQSAPIAKLELHVAPPAGAAVSSLKVRSRTGKRLLSDVGPPAPMPHEEDLPAGHYSVEAHVARPDAQFETTSDIVRVDPPTTRKSINVSKSTAATS